MERLHSINKGIDKASNLLFIIGIVCTILYYSYRLTYLISMGVICGVTLFILLIVTRQIEKKIFFYIISFISVFTFFYLIKILFYQKIGYTDPFIFMFMHFGFALFFFYKNISFNIYRVIFIIVNILLFYYFINGGLLKDLSEFASGNFVNFNVLAFSVLLSALYYDKKNLIVLYPAVISLIVSFWSLGRSGIIVSSIFLFGLIFLKYKEKLNKVSIGLIFLAIPLLIPFIFKYFYQIVESVLYRFGERDNFIDDSPRTHIWSSYFEEFNFERFTFGSDFNLHEFWGFTNLHNSFLHIHNQFGIAGILACIILLFSLIYSLKKKQYVYGLLMFCILLRGFFDIVILISRYDYIVLYLVLLLFFQNGNSRTRAVN